MTDTATSSQKHSITIPFDEVDGAIEADLLLHLPDADLPRPATTLDRVATQLYRHIAHILRASRDTTVTPILNTTTH